MILHHAFDPRLARAAALTAAATTLASAAGALCLPAAADVVRAGRAARFDELLVAGCSVATLGAAIALLAASLGVLTDLLRGRAPRTRSPVRRLVLAACGIAVVATAATGPARADSSLGGLPLPDRATGARVAADPGDPRDPGDPGDPGNHVTVRPGDSLWSIAERHLEPAADDAEVSTYVHRLHRLNRRVIGPDPDRILPGQTLHLPRR